MSLDNNFPYLYECVLVTRYARLPNSSNSITIYAEPEKQDGTLKVVKKFPNLRHDLEDGLVSLRYSVNL